MAAARNQTATTRATRPNRAIWVAGAVVAGLVGVAGVILLVSRGGSAEDPAPVRAAAPAVDARVVYDPTRLVENGVPAGEVYLKEPRDPVWADVVETVVGGKMRGDLERLVPGASLQIVCKTLSCLIGVDAPEGKHALALAVVKVIMLGPLLVDFDPEEDGTRRYVFLTEPRMSDPQVFTDWYQNTRKRTFEAIKAGTRENPIPVPAEQLPDQ
jgi:hypothetical protein